MCVWLIEVGVRVRGGAGVGSRVITFGPGADRDTNLLALHRTRAPFGGVGAVQCVRGRGGSVGWRREVRGLTGRAVGVHDEVTGPVPAGEASRWRPVRHVVDDSVDNPSRVAD